MLYNEGHERGEHEVACRVRGTQNCAWEQTLSDAAWVGLNGGRRKETEEPNGCAKRQNLRGWEGVECHCYDGDWFRDLAYSSSWLMKPRFGCAFILLD